MVSNAALIPPQSATAPVSQPLVTAKASKRSRHKHQPSAAMRLARRFKYENGEVYNPVIQLHCPLQEEAKRPETAMVVSAVSQPAFPQPVAEHEGKAETRSSNKPEAKAEAEAEPAQRTIKTQVQTQVQTKAMETARVTKEGQEEAASAVPKLELAVAGTRTRCIEYRQPSRRRRRRKKAKDSENETPEESDQNEEKGTKKKEEVPHVPPEESKEKAEELKALEDLHKKVLPPEEIVSKHEKGQALLSSADLPYGKLKGVWLVENLGTVLRQSDLTCITSPSFGTMGGGQFRLRLDPKGDPRGSKESIGMFVENLCPPSERKRTTWTLCLFVKALMGSSKSRARNKYIVRLTTTKQFDEVDNLWGSEKFLYWSCIFKRKLAQILQVQFTVKPIATLVDPDPAPPLGLVNLGTTCYVNSMLQTLFAIKEFRRAIFAIPTTEADIGTTSYALQRVCYKLQRPNEKREAVGIRELLLAFGWKEADFHEQHDIQEFRCFLADTFEKLEEKLKTTPLAGVFQRLFEGKMTNRIECVDLDYKSAHEESFTDLQLIVRGCSTLYECFDQYIAQELLIGDNSYRTEHQGLQKATKGLYFTHLPPVLQLHLKRFNYNAVQVRKINDKLAFESILDLNKYCSDAQHTDYTYQLHAVVVHKGSPQSGHYFAYIRQGEHWRKFDDESVKCVERKVAIEENFGGEYNTVLVDSKTGNIVLQRKEKTSSAYMLVYIRCNAYVSLQSPITEADIPPHLRTRFEEEERMFVRQQEETEKIETTVPIYILSPDIVDGWSGFSIGPGSETREQALGFIDDPKYRVRMLCDPNQTLHSFTQDIAAQLHVPTEDLGVWQYDILKGSITFTTQRKLNVNTLLKELGTTHESAGKSAKSSKPPRGLFIVWLDLQQKQPIFVPIPEEYRRKRADELLKLRDFFLAIKRDELMTTLDTENAYWKLAEKAEHTSSSSRPEGNWRLVFAKYYDPKTEYLKLIKVLVLSKGQTLALVVSAVRTACNLSQDPSDIYEEFNPPEACLRRSLKKLQITLDASDLKNVTTIICTLEDESNSSAKRTKLQEHLEALLTAQSHRS